MQLERNRIEVEFIGKQETCRAFLLCLSADLPTSSVFNMVQSKGEYSCVKCLQRDENFHTEKGGNVRVFSYLATDSLCTDNTVRQDVLPNFTDAMSNHLEALKGPQF